MTADLSMKPNWLPPQEVAQPMFRESMPPGVTEWWEQIQEDMELSRGWFYEPHRWGEYMKTPWDEGGTEA